MSVQVIGAGLAGTEAAWQLAKRGIKVTLYEMRPGTMTPAHHTSNMAELVCSNSFRSNRLANAVGLLKEEMRQLDSLVIRAADASSVPAGGALAVDRSRFSAYIEDVLINHPMVRVIREEVTEIPKGVTIIATGPLTSDVFAEKIMMLPGLERLFFYDAAAPILTLESLNMDKVFRQSRYSRDSDYLNCPMDESEYHRFVQELVNAETAPVQGFEETKVFEGCLPVESIARRGRMSLAFGPMKPVGLTDPRTGKRAFAVVQLRQDNEAGTLYNMVGFQTRLTFGEQRRVFTMIPGLEDAGFVRYGVMHRNTYIRSPGFLDASYQVKTRPDLFFAGQITGVEGYVESAASGLMAGMNAALRVKGESPVFFPCTTAIGALAYYISSPHNDFQPMHSSFGIMEGLPQKDKGLKRGKTARCEAVAQRALSVIDGIRVYRELMQGACDD
jgi:methylenetetrahydrofolate--tRNA-(uracil-5-)-methyltransferase